MRAFERTAGGVVWHCSEVEVGLLASMATQLIELVDPPAEATDPFAALQAELEADPLDRDDPAVARLFPAAYREDDAADAEFRALTEAAMRRAKACEAQVVLDALAAADLPAGSGDEGSGVVTVPDADVDAWLRTLNALRLTLGARLGIETAEIAAVVDELDDDHPAYPVVQMYHWLGYVQTALLEAL